MIKWQMFDKGHSDKLMSADLEMDGALDTDVLIKNTPWTGGTPTKRDRISLDALATAVHKPSKRVEVEWRPSYG